MIKRVVALGFFDGVHIGHGELLKRVKQKGKELSLTPSVLTYSEHPSRVLSADSVKLINTTETRCELIREIYGIEDVVVKEFTKEYASLSCEAFADEVLISELSAEYVVAGFDFRFGKNGAGDAKKLCELCRERNIGCDIIDRVEFDGKTVSSSRIRKLISEGDVSSAARILGHRHCIAEEVMHGANLGEKIGFPTINQEISPSLCVPAYGVYATYVFINGKKYTGVTNVGVRPTVANSKTPRAETYVVGFCGNLYGKRIKLEFVRFLRPEKKFSSVEELSKQIACDVELAKKETAADC